MSRKERAALQRDINALLQENERIAVDGIVGPNTLRKLAQVLGVSEDDLNAKTDFQHLKTKALEARNARQLELSQEELADYPYLSAVNNALDSITMRSSPDDIQAAMDVLMHHVGLATD